MKNKLDWFDENWNLDVKPHTVILDLLLSPTYRIPKQVKQICSYKWVLIFQNVHDVAVQWNVSTNASVTAAVND